MSAAPVEVTQTRRAVTDLDTGSRHGGAESASPGDADSRSTSPPTASRTAAATAARQRQAAERAAVRLGIEQLGHLPDRHLVNLAAVLLGELERRRLSLEVP